MTEQNKTNTAPAQGGSELAKRGVLKFNITSDKMLYACFMPYVDGCGLFVPTEVEYKLGDEAFVLLQLPEDHGNFATSAKVVWLNPKQKQGKRVPGVGLQIMGKDVDTIRAKVEEILGKKIASPLPTATM